MEFLIAADDRTGALEMAGALAHDGAGVVPTLTSLGDLSSVGSRAAVVDLATRHLVSDTAATRAVGVDAIGADPVRPQDRLHAARQLGERARGAARRDGTSGAGGPGLPGARSDVRRGSRVRRRRPGARGRGGSRRADTDQHQPARRPAPSSRGARRRRLPRPHRPRRLARGAGRNRRRRRGHRRRPGRDRQPVGRRRRRAARRHVGGHRRRRCAALRQRGAQRASERARIRCSSCAAVPTRAPSSRSSGPRNRVRRSLRDGYELAVDAVAAGEPIVLAPPAPVERGVGRCGRGDGRRRWRGRCRRSPRSTSSARSS